MKTTSSPFLPKFFPRLLAGGCVLVLIGSLALACILGISILGPALSHGTHIDHAAGEIVSIGPGRQFVLLTTTGQRLVFECGTNCRASLAHMQRHLNEHAHTDVYYVKGVNRVLMALDVD